MTKLKALRDLKITKDKGLTPDNIDKVIDVLLETPKDQFGNDKYSLNKVELLDLYYKARTIFKDKSNITRIWFSITCYKESSNNDIENDEWELIRE